MTSGIIFGLEMRLSIRSQNLSGCCFRQSWYHRTCNTWNILFQLLSKIYPIHIVVNEQYVSEHGSDILQLTWHTPKGITLSHPHKLPVVMWSVRVQMREWHSKWFNHEIIIFTTTASAQARTHTIGSLLFIKTPSSFLLKSHLRRYEMQKNLYSS